MISSDCDGTAIKVVRIAMEIADNNLNIWMTIPTGTRRDYLADIIKDSGIPRKVS